MRRNLPFRSIWIEALSLFFAPAFWIFALIAVGFVRGRWALRRMFREPWFASPAVITIDWSPPGLTWMEGADKIELEWPEISEAFTDRRWILFRQGERAFMIPRRVLTPAQAENLLACAARREKAGGLAETEKTASP